MKKTNRKLVLRSETIRALSAQALTRIIGGQETADAVPHSRDKVCLIAAVPHSRDRGCEIAAVPHSGDKVCLTA
jgi:hypothetical protein